MNIDEGNRWLFLLGGYDLEMLTIRQVLNEQNIPYVDHQLRWDNAKLSNYRKELDEAIFNGRSVFGVELQEDIPVPEGYKAIDHHNVQQDVPSALEQVMELLHLPLNRHLKLVAANDKAYIPGMKELGAKQEEIDLIRRSDRKIQGVTDEDEILAERAISENCTKVNDLWVVHAFSSHFSPICDRLFPYDHLLVFTDQEWVYYGKGVEVVKNYFKQDVLAGNIYYGGGDEGYVGLKCNAYPSTKIMEMVESIKKRI